MFAMGEFFDREWDPIFERVRLKMGWDGWTFILDVDLSIRGECQGWARARWY
jgi:hypothetical protein